MKLRIDWLPRLAIEHDVNAADHRVRAVGGGEERGHDVRTALVLCNREILNAGVGELQPGEGNSVGVLGEVVEHEITGGVDELSVGLMRVGVLAKVAGPLIAAFENDLLEGIGEAGDDHVVPVDVDTVGGLRAGDAELSPGGDAFLRAAAESGAVDRIKL